MSEFNYDEKADLTEDLSIDELFDEVLGTVNEAKNRDDRGDMQYYMSEAQDLLKTISNRIFDES